MFNFLRNLFSSKSSKQKSKPTYLFFDVECANCFDGVGKMCSFGYVLTDTKFRILESADLVMNPECQFDWYLFKNKNDIKLAYSKEYFYSQPNFKHFYPKINELLTAPNRKIFTFGFASDVGFVVTAVERYKMPWIDFEATDIEKNTKEENGIHGGLGERCAMLGIDDSDLTEHNSRDDAMMTMRLLKTWCKNKKISADEFLGNSKDSACSAQKFVKMRARRMKKKAMKAARTKSNAKRGTNHSAS